MRLPSSSFTACPAHCDCLLMVSIPAADPKYKMIINDQLAQAINMCFVKFVEAMLHTCWLSITSRW
jgi:hypothetical protein